MVKSNWQKKALQTKLTKFLINNKGKIISSKKYVRQSKLGKARVIRQKIHKVKLRFTHKKGYNQVVIAF